jgi:predicted transcriptional regulator
MSNADNEVLVAQILSSYLANNTVSPADLYSVIATVKRAFGDGVGLSTNAAPNEEARNWQPAVPVKKSVTSDAITCLCCGEKFKSLKRHLNAEHKMTPEEYKAAFKLRANYPLVAPNYTARRSALAKSLGLGRMARKRRGAGVTRRGTKSATTK